MVKLIFTLITICFAINIGNCTKLNYPRVLLPIFDKNSINFTLEVIEKGCFKWISSRQDLIQITPLYDDSDIECSYKAVVTVLTKEKRRNTALVLAESLNSREFLRCDVILDVIDQLGVLTTTRELYLEEAPETFELWAQDSQGNAFTTLEGVEFHWQILQTDGNQDDKRNTNWQQVLRFLTFTESKYHEVPSTLEKFESAGIRGYMVLLEAINTGTAKVSVRMPYSEYNHVSVIVVDIMVLANIILDPTDVNVMVGDTVNFRILQLKQGKLEEISLNKQYYLEIKDSKIAQIHGNSATGLKLGKTKVVLRDRNVPDSNPSGGDSMKSLVPTATFTVAEANKMTINLLPHYNWITVEGEKHEIAIDLYTSDEQKILLGPKYKMNSNFDETIFYPIFKSQNGSRIYGEAVREGKSSVQGTFNSLSAKAELHVYPELSLTPTFAILPYDLNTLRTQKILFTAFGGDGDYIWSSHNPSILHINSNGLAETKLESDRRGESDQYHDDNLKAHLTKHTNIKVGLARNTKLYRSAEIYFLPPVKLEIIKYNFETSLHDLVKLYVAVYAFVNNTYVPFTKCDNLNFEFEFTNQIFQLESYNSRDIIDIPGMAESACHLINLRSSSIGTTNLKLSYRFMDKILSDDVTLMVFEKLSIINPISNNIILPIGSTRNIIYFNGPQQVFNLDSELIKNITINNEIAEINEIYITTSKSLYAFQVLCKKIGEIQLNLEMFNQLMTKNFMPYISKLNTMISCVKPRFINLYTTEELRQSCPLEMKNSLMQIKERDENIEIQIEVLDERNRQLMNISSLFIDWEFYEAEIRYDKDLNYNLKQDVEYIEGIPIPDKDFLKVKIMEPINKLKIKGIVSKYDMTILEKRQVTPEIPNFGIFKSKSGKYVKPLIENEINFVAVNSTLFPFENLSIFMAKNRAERIKIVQGSGFYEFELSENGIISVEFDVKQRELIVVPLKIGHVVIELIDRCLMSEPARLSISVVSIGSIEIDVPDRIEKTKSVEGIIKLYDINDNLINIDNSNLQIYELNEEIFNPYIVCAKLGDQLNLQKGEIRYLITGNELGETKMLFNSGSGNKAIFSNSVNIQVFPPLRLYPRNSTLIIGTSLQIHHQGGPHPDVSIVYTVHNQNTATMDSALVLARKLGNTKITGKCIGVNPITGKQIVYSEDTIEVFVVTLENIQIRTPLVRIKSGAVMPATIWGGIPELSPIILGTLGNIKIIWSTNQPDVVDIYNIFAEIGVEYTEDDLITVRVKALNPGKAKIQANVILSNGKKFTSSVEVTVFKILELESPKSIKMDTILIAPRSTIQLKANLDNVLYKMDSTDDIISSSRIIKVSSDGVVRSGEALGRDLIMAKTFEQTLPIGVEVKNVQYILASLDYPSIKLKQIEDKIPRGMNIVLKISLHDNLGNEFSRNIDDIHGIKYNLANKDMVDIQIGNNLTVGINFPRETNNMIAISLKDSTGVKHADDYIKVSVAESKYIFPTKTIFSVGDIICFDSPLTLATLWTSSDERIVSIDRYTGIGKVLGHRSKNGEKIIVTNGEKSGSYIKYDLEIREADKIEFLNSYDIFSNADYHGYLVMRNHLQIDKFSNLMAKNISKCTKFVEKQTSVKFFACRMTSKQQLGILVLENYKVTPIFHKEKGMYACAIEIVTSISAVMNIIKASDLNIELEAQLPNGVTDTLTLKIIPGIKVTPDMLSIDQLSQQGIIITGIDKVLQKIVVKPSDASFLEIIPQAKAHGALQYKVKLLNELPSGEQLFIHIHSPLTQQDIELPILGPSSLIQKCASQPFNNSTAFLFKFISNLGAIISTLICLSAIVWVATFGLPGRTQTKINNEAFSTSLKDRSNVSNLSDMSNIDRTHLSTSRSPRGQSYNSPLYNRSHSPSLNFTTESESPVYGDNSTFSPQRRLNRRYI